MRTVWLALILAAECATLAGCNTARDAEAREALAMTDGDPARGQVMMRSYGCETCHVIPGVEGAEARVGPSLAGIATRSYIGGVLTNTPSNMLRWLRDPPSVDSQTAMPNVGVTPADARHLAAYLYTLR